MPDDDGARVPADLSGVPETLLWNLYHRAQATRGRRPLLVDPRAVDLVRRIDYPFEQFGGRRRRAGAQWHALRVRQFDGEVRRFLAQHPGGTVVALGEGLETQFWRVDDGRVRWVTVDLPETIDLRRRLLPEGPRQRSLSYSVTDPGWMDHVEVPQGVLLTAQGLLMYLQPAEVDQLVRGCASRFPGAALVFDAIPTPMLDQRAQWDRSDRRHGYRFPSWAWGLDDATSRRLSSLPGVAGLERLPALRGRGLLFGALLPALRHVPRLRPYDPQSPVLRARFEP